MLRQYSEAHKIAGRVSFINPKPAGKVAPGCWPGLSHSGKQRLFRRSTGPAKAPVQAQFMEGKPPRRRYILNRQEASSGDFARTRLPWKKPLTLRRQPI